MCVFLLDWDGGDSGLMGGGGGGSDQKKLQVCRNCCFGLLRTDVHSCRTCWSETFMWNWKIGFWKLQTEDGALILISLSCGSSSERCCSTPAVSCSKHVTTRFGQTSSGLWCKKTRWTDEPPMELLSEWPHIETILSRTSSEISKQTFITSRIDYGDGLWSGIIPAFSVSWISSYIPVLFCSVRLPFPVDPLTALSFPHDSGSRNISAALKLHDLLCTHAYR